MRNIYRTLFFVMLVLLSCSEEQYEQATITFYPTLNATVDEPQPGTAGAPLTINLLTSRVLATESQVNIRIEGNGAGYANSYETFPPQLEPGIVTVTIPPGEKSAYFTFTPVNDGIGFVNDYQYTFSVDGASHAIKSIGQGVFKCTVLDYALPIYETNFDDCNETTYSFTEQIAGGAMESSTWGCTDFGYPDEETVAAEANAFGKGAGISNSYLLKDEPLDGASFDLFIVDLKVYSRFPGAGALKIVYSTNYSGNGDPEAEGVTWNEAELITEMPAAGSREWVDVRATIPSNGDEPVYLAFQFKGGTTSSSSNWRIEDLVIKAK